MTDLDDRVRQALSERYDVEGQLGRGGMAVVYAARDLKHGRRVALKVLAPELARSVGDERFLREIEIAARLDHPRIVPLLDSGTADGLLFYTMPLVDGESLRDRLDRDKQLPVDEAIEITRQTASALAYAHGQGVVHRDIKPENLLLAGGEVRVADFGIGRALAAAGGSQLTETGIAVGTPAYMSPEQAAGAAEVDGRSDVYALACVLYEMLVGEPPFTGPNAQAVTTRKLSQQPPNVAMVRDSVPLAVADAVTRALARLPADRFGSATQFAEALRLAKESVRVGAGAPVRSGFSSRERTLTVALLAAATLLAVVAFRAWPALRASDPPAPVRMIGALPPGVTVTQGPSYASSVALSPDGRTLVVAGTSADGQRLYERRLDRLEATPVEGSEGGSSPFFSPDGAWIAFLAEGRLRRVPAGGGAAVDIITVSNFLGGASWGHDDRIAFVSGGRSPVFAVSARGGDAEQLTRFAEGEVSHAHPEFLPDGRTLLFSAGGWIHALDVSTGSRKALTEGASPRYAASGHLILGRESTLLAAPFDASRVELTGAVVPLVDGLAERSWQSHYALSGNGTLAYFPGAAAHDLVLIEAEGTQRLVSDEWLSFENPQFSPDGRRIAVAARRRSGESTDLWIYDLAAGTASRLTFDGGRAPVWTPDGTAVTFSKPNDPRGLYRKAADGRGDAELLLPLDDFHWLVGWTPDAHSLAFGTMEGPGEEGRSSSSIVVLENGESRRIIGPGSVWGGRLSPDGRWLAYYTLEAGRFEVYVTPFPGGSERWLISDEGGRDPSWSPDGTELYYRNGDRLMAARVDTTTGLRVLTRRVVLEPFMPPLYDDYDVHPDGRTLVIVRPREPSGRDVVLVLDWLAEVRQLARE